jgi:hypothetical protein
VEEKAFAPISSFAHQELDCGMMLPNCCAMTFIATRLIGRSAAPSWAYVHHSPVLSIIPRKSTQREHIAKIGNAMKSMTSNNVAS